MTDAKDTRDTPPRKRVRVDAHTDWMQERITTEHKAWLEGNGRLAVHHFTSGWLVHAPDIAAPETAVLQDIASAYNAKMLQTAIVGKSTYRTLFREMQAYEASLSHGLREELPSLTQAQVDGITAICDMFRRDWVQKSFKASFELAAQRKPSSQR